MARAARLWEVVSLFLWVGITTVVEYQNGTSYKDLQKPIAYDSLRSCVLGGAPSWSTEW